MIFFTADFHLSHKNILKYCNRPFKNIEDMNKTILQNIEESIKPKFNSRKDLLQSNDLETFISEKYKIAYERFWGYHTADSFYSLVARMPGLGDYGYPDLYETNFAIMFGNVLDKYGIDWEFPPP